MHRLRWGLLAAAVVVVALAVLLAAVPFDSGDNFCGNLFVNRAHGQGQFNGCDHVRSYQLGGVMALGLLSVGLLVASRLVERSAARSR